MSETKLERFIPYCKAEVIDLLCDENKIDAKQFRTFCKILESLYHFEFHDKMGKLKEDYFPFDPDKDVMSQRKYSKKVLQDHEKKLVDNFREILGHANYEQITQEQMEYTLRQESLFKVILHVDFDDFEKQLIFWRGEGSQILTVRKWVFLKRDIEVKTFSRVAIMVKFKDAAYFKEKKRKRLWFQPGSMIIKLFKDIPQSDLEMLFPNTQVKMNLKDKLFMGIPATIGGISVIFYKGFAIFAAVPIFYFMARSFVTQKPISFTEQQLTLLIGAGTALAAIIGYLWRQWDKFRNRKMRFMKTLSDNLYFKNLDNNSGVFHHLIDAAEEEEFKEAILGYYFLLMYPEGLTEKALDEVIEKWFAENHQVELDFEVDDALRKLKELELCKVIGEGSAAIYQALPLQQGCERLDYIWDNFFQFNNQ